MGDGDDATALRERVEAAYDFEEFGPAEMRELTGEEWEAVFDPESWITGQELLDRVERDLRARIARREVFAALERTTRDDEQVLRAWSDEGGAVVRPDGTVEGRGTVFRDVTATVALCSMDDYEVPEPPADHEIPDPEDVTAGTGEFGNLMLQIVATTQLLGGLAILGGWVFTNVTTIVAPVAGVAFVLVGGFLFAVVANARLSDRFRADEFRERLRAVETAAERSE